MRQEIKKKRSRIKKWKSKENEVEMHYEEVVAVQYIDSREVAEIVGKEHSMLLRDIRRYIEQLGQSKIAQSDFFTESTYRNSQNKTQPCYLVTKKGCEFIAHKLTGIKGTKFKATYSAELA